MKHGRINRFRPFSVSRAEFKSLQAKVREAGHDLAIFSSSIHQPLLASRTVIVSSSASIIRLVPAFAASLDRRRQSVDVSSGAYSCALSLSWGFGYTISRFIMPLSLGCPSFSSIEDPQPRCDCALGLPRFRCCRLRVRGRRCNQRWGYPCSSGAMRLVPKSLIYYSGLSLAKSSFLAVLNR